MVVFVFSVHFKKRLFVHNVQMNISTEIILIDVPHAGLIVHVQYTKR